MSEHITIVKNLPVNDTKGWTTDTPFLVIVNHYDHDISWAQKLIFPHVIYYKERQDKEPFSASNKAKSETNLLKFIVDFYDRLPKNIIIVHQYERKFYHEGSLIDILNDPQFETKYKESKSVGFWCFNTQLLGSVHQQLGRMIGSGWWPKCMEPYFGPIEKYGDFTNGKRGCAQFVVSRERILSLPKQFYINMYDWLVANTLDEKSTGYDPITLCRNHSESWDHPRSSHYTARYMEWSWELIFTLLKEDEDLSVVLPRGKKISARYGARNFYRDVTAHVIKYCVNVIDDTIVIPQNFNFNEMFGDPIFGSVKTFYLTVDGKTLEMTEDHTITL